MLRKKSFISLVVLVATLCFSQGVSAEKLYFESFVTGNEHTIGLEGDTAGAQFGGEIKKGDLNADGIEDLVIASPFYTYEDREWNGAVSVYFGNKNGDMDASWRFYGEFSGDQLGTSLEIGDYNNDGINDLAIGAYNAHDKSGRPGKVYIYYGGVDNGTVSSRHVDFLKEMPSMILKGEDYGDNFGLSLSTVDINLDGIDDLLVGAPLASPGKVDNAGAVYVYIGQNRGLTQITTIEGQEMATRFGSSVSAGHVISQEYISIIVGAYAAHGDLTSQVGKLYAYKFVQGNL